MPFKYTDASTHPAKRVEMGIESDSTRWLAQLLHGNVAFRGWHAEYKRLERRWLLGNHSHSFLVNRDLRFALLMTITIEAEINYRLFGELVPSGD